MHWRTMIKLILLLSAVIALTSPHAIGANSSTVSLEERSLYSVFLNATYGSSKFLLIAGQTEGTWTQASEQAWRCVWARANQKPDSGTLSDLLVKSRDSARYFDTLNLKCNYRFVSEEDMDSLGKYRDYPFQRRLKNLAPIGTGASMVVILSRIGFSKDRNQAILVCDEFRGRLASKRTMYLLTKSNGRWSVVAQCPHSIS